MAIITQSFGAIPAVSLDHVHIDNFSLSTARLGSHRVAFAVQFIPYGMDRSTDPPTRIYDPRGPRNAAIRDVDAYIADLPAEKQPAAFAALVKIQEGLGTLVALETGTDPAEVTTE